MMDERDARADEGAWIARTLDRLRSEPFVTPSLDSGYSETPALVPAPGLRRAEPIQPIHTPTMIDPDHLGMLAGTLTTAAFVPQAWRVWKRRSAEDLSLPTFFIFSTGVVCWLAFGLMVRSTPIIVANAATLAIAVSIIWMAVRFRRR